MPGLLWYNRGMRLKQWFLVGIGIVVLWFLYVERTILTPFILAAIFAYLFNPLVNAITKKLRLPKTLIILLVYSLLLTIVISTGVILSRRISLESIDITKVANTLIENARYQSRSLPDWLSPLVLDLLITLKKSRFISFIESPSAFFVINQAISRVISFLIFLFSGFYFLKDGEGFVNKALTYMPHRHRADVEMLLSKINMVLNGYLRGQILLIFVMSLVHYIALSILGIQFALTIAVFSGFAEIVPVIGPITACTLAVIVSLLTGTANFGLQPIQAALIVIVIYFVLRYLEDYLLIPHIMERVTKLPPFVVFFAVIAGGHIAGILGLVLAVPLAAIIRILLEFSTEKVFTVKN